MERRRLVSFLALTEELHFHRAAARCHITQSALSQQIMQLEAELQVRLVNRTKRSVSLTRTGEVFATEARKIVRSMDEAAKLARQAESGTIGRLVVGATAPAMFTVLPEIVTAFCADMPNVEIAVRNLTTAELEQALSRGEIDVGIVHPPLDDKELVCHDIATLPFDLVLSESNPLSARKELRMGDLVNETLILFPRQIGPQLYDRIIGLCLDQGFSPRSIIEMTPAQSIISMAACNLGVGFIASRLQHFTRPQVTYRRIVDPTPSFMLGIASRAEVGTVALQRFVNLAIEIGGKAS
ncbi:MAG: LysR family transcriptional regulator [Rhizobiaceae bacterium]|nr:LysR family transcriptional regulator [Rhizobiaceae bacterium]